MPHAMDDFTIILPELTDMASCDLKVYGGLDRLWRMVERYKMTAPITITVVDRPDTFGQFGAIVSRQGAWQLEDATNAATPPLGGEFEFPLTSKVQDGKGNISGQPEPYPRRNGAG